MSNFGSLIPLGEPNWYQGLNTPFYHDTHALWRERVRDFCEDVVEPRVYEWEQASVTNNHNKCVAIIREVYTKAAQAGVLPGVVGKPWPSKFTSCEAPQEYDMFHELICIDELARMGGGISWAMVGGMGIGLPPILNFGMPKNPALMERVCRECLSGEKIICLCITEPGAGSDVAAIACTAVDKGDHYLVEGSKKWITNGIFADYFTVAVRTGGPNSRHKGLSMLLLEKSMPGITCRKIDCMGVWSSGTTFITFENVRVPKENIIGVEGEGFKQIMYNFNHERWMLAAQASRMARTCVEESLSFARSRQTFGKYLIEHQVIQHKIAEMGRVCEATHAMLENISYQMNTMDKEEQNRRLGGYIALLKVQASKTLEYCAREALQVFGGAGYTRTGKGEKVERIYREVRAFSIPGGSEEIMLNLAAGQFKFVSRAMPDPRDAEIDRLHKELKAARMALKAAL